MHAVCNICSDLFDSAKDVAAIPCGHTFHRTCLDEWTKIQKTCPQCRLKFTAKNVIPKLYFETSDDHATVDAADLQNQIQSLQTTLLVKEKEKNEIHKIKEDLQCQVVVLEIHRSQLETELHTVRTEKSVLQSQLQFLDQQISEAQKAKSEAKTLRNKLTELQNLEKILKGSESEMEVVLQSYGARNSVNQSLIECCAVLKRQLQRTTEQKRQLNQEAENAKRQTSDLHSRLRHQEITIAELQADLKHSEESQDGLRKKLAALKASINSPTGVSAKGVLSRFVAESPTPWSTKESSGSTGADGDNVFSTPDKILTCSPLINTPNMGAPSKIKTKPAVVRTHNDSSFKMFMESHNPRKKIAITSLSASPSRERPNLLTATHVATNRGTGYNGLGGHSKPDIFPKQGVSGIMKLKRPVKRPTLLSRQQLGQQNTLTDLVNFISP